MKIVWPAYLLALTGGGGSSIELVIPIWVSEAPALWLYIELDPSPPSPQALLQLPGGNLIPCNNKVPLSESHHDCHSGCCAGAAPVSGLDPVFMAPLGGLPSSHTLMPACSGAGFSLPLNLGAGAGVVWVLVNLSRCSAHPSSPSCLFVFLPVQLASSSPALSPFPSSTSLRKSWLYQLFPSHFSF